ncbi:site-2 protease family protein [Nocardia amamiensis]|uniref:Zinc metalloprotease n=1 Tax=Nocardia amamiensis TaxID=404578 RepID=A0ABS0D0A8_9NOCA|nr:site-2 protease family protein [Nocardia amamiensis]MBF6301548.1 site-2 protease family protein [Nocardia amamiensis]
MMRQTFSLGRLSGIHIGAHWSALVTVGLFTWILGSYLTGTAATAVVWATAVIGAIALCAALLAHELAHSIVARRNGIRVERIVLWLLGGVSELTDEPRDARADLRIAVAGPVTSLAIAVVAFVGAAAIAAADPDGPITAVLVWLAVMNAVLGLFNLLPGAPLDGGRVLRAAIWSRTGDRLRAATWAARSGQFLGTFLLMLGLAELILFGHLGGVWLMLLGWFLQSAAYAELTVAGLRHRLGDSTVRDVMTARPMAIPAAWSITELLHSNAVASGHRVFPVVDDAGHPIAVVAWSDLAAVAEPARTTSTVGGAARTLPAGAIAREDEPLGDVASRVVLRPNLDAIAVIDADGKLTGLITSTDLVLACDRSALGLPLRIGEGPRLSSATDEGYTR